MKISVSGVKNRQQFDLSHDVNTTSNFGFCQPLFCKEMMPNSKISTKLHTQVRLAPMPVPTYGRLQLRTYNCFVPYTDLLESFDNFLASQTYNSPISAYIPTALPMIHNNFLVDILLYNSYWTVYKRSGTTTTYNAITTADTAGQTAARAAFKLDLTENWNFDEWPAGDIFYPSFTSMSASNSIPFPPIHADGADLLYVSKDQTYMFAIKFNTYGKNVRKVLLNLGYSINIQNSTDVSLLPLFAYYKGWFDIFAPQLKQNEQYTDTNAYKILMYISMYNAPAFGTFGSNSSLFVAFRDFIIADLPKCYYYYDTDYISAHIVDTAVSQNIGSLTLVQPNGGKNTVQGSVNQQATVGLNPSNTLSKLSFDVVNRLTRYINKNTVVGSNVSKLIQTLYGVKDNHLADVKLLHSESTDIFIGEVFNQAGVAGQTLGEYAGRGIGEKHGDFCTFETRSFGCFFTYACIVPRSQFAQGLDYELLHVDKFRLPTPQFDSLGYQVSNKDVVFDQVDAINFTRSEPTRQQFGYIPRYFEHKVKLSKISGDMSLRSTRSSFIPYTLDKYIAPSELVVSNNTDTSLVYSSALDAPVFLPGAGTVWRQCGLYPYLSNFNRIFNNTGVHPLEFQYSEEDINDNFILHNYIECKYFAPLSSIKDSFDTNDGEDTFDVNKQ